MIRWGNTLTGGLRRVRAAAENLEDDAAEGGDVILAASNELVPKESGDLLATGMVHKDRAGNNAVGIVYSSVYARWIHEHLHFKHPHGGQAKFLETAMLTKGREAVNKAGEHFWRRL